MELCDVQVTQAHCPRAVAILRLARQLWRRDSPARAWGRTLRRAVLVAPHPRERWRTANQTHLGRVV